MRGEKWLNTWVSFRFVSNTEEPKRMGAWSASANAWIGPVDLGAPSRALSGAQRAFAVPRAHDVLPCTRGARPGRTVQGAEVPNEWLEQWGGLHTTAPLPIEGRRLKRELH